VDDAYRHLAVGVSGGCVAHGAGYLGYVVCDARISECDSPGKVRLARPDHRRHRNHPGYLRCAELVGELDRCAEARHEQTEAISLAFITTLQVLPPRQIAVLILRDVLGFHADEVADMLDSTVESVRSDLKRARANLQRRRPRADDRQPPPACDSPAEDAVVAKFVRAWESADLDVLVALLTDDVFMSMPPIPFEYEGRDVVARFCARLFRAGSRFDLVPTRANGQPAFGAYLRRRTGISHGVGLYVLGLTGDRICAMTRFDNGVLPWFGLPRSLPSS
jgi:Sigma-70, region 4/SnoaL-like domain